MRFPVLFATLLSLALAASDVPDIEDGFQKVTCGSTIKLTSESTGYKLHSHGVSYGSGSGQQSITAFPEKDDSNSFWVVQAGSHRGCHRGEPVPCGATIRLRHSNTKGFLHSHLHQSPLSHQQEVSCFDGLDTGDDWKVECANPSSKFWLREEPIQLVHLDSKVYLSTSSHHRYGQPIPGQLEVAGTKSQSSNTRWAAQEGIYFAENKSGQ